MKGRDWERLARREILPALGDDYTVKGSLVYRRPVEHILLGVHAETMYEATHLRFQAVVMPLYLPVDYMNYFVPNDLGDIDVEDSKLPPGTVDLFLKAVPFLEGHATPELLLADPSWKRADDVVRLEVEGFSYLLAGDAGPARRVLEHALNLDPERDWEAEIQGRCQRVLALMEESLDKACAQLVEWEDQTLTALRLTRQ